MTELESLRQVLTDYTEFQKLCPVPSDVGTLHKTMVRPDLVLVGVTLSPTPGVAPDGVTVPVAATGWVRHRSDVGKIGSDELSGPDLGQIIAAEWLHDGRTVHLRPDPDTPGTLREMSYCVRTLDAGAALTPGEIPCLRQEIAILKHPSPTDRRPAAATTTSPVLLYHVFWGGAPDDPHTPRRLFTLFIGFADRDMVIPADLGAPRSRPSPQAQR